MHSLPIVTGLLIIPGLVLGGCILLIKLMNQRERDNHRTTYILNFPADLDYERVVAFLRAVSRSMSGHAMNFTASQTMVFELIATDRGISHRLKVPWQKEDDIIPQLRALAPGISATPLESWETPELTYAVEIGETNKSRPLAIPNAQDVAASILASVQPLKDGELVMMQWVVTPAPRHALPNERTESDQFSLLGSFASRTNKDEIKERRDKLGEPNVMGVLRVAARANTKPRAEHLTDRVKTSYKATETPHNTWYKRTALVSQVIDRTQRAASLTTWPAQLNITELAALIGWPIGNPNVSGLPGGASRQIPVTALVPTEGVPVGYSTFPDQNQRKVAISYESALMHTVILGATGTGKSTVMANMAAKIMRDGKGLIVIETEGNLYDSVLSYVPRERTDDLVVLDVTDTLKPVGLNVLDQGDPMTMIDALVELFEYQYDNSLWTDEYLGNGLKTLVEIGGMAFTDLLPLLNPQTPEEIKWADSITRQVKDPELRRWWAGHENRGKRDQQQRVSPVLSRLSKLVRRPELRNIFGQRTSSFQLDDIMRDHKILLVNLKGTSPDTAKLIATLLMTMIQQSTVRVQKTEPVFLMMDEFGDFMDIPVNFERMFAQFRKRNVPLIVASQNMSQMKPQVRDGVTTNARNKITLASNPDDAKTLLRSMHNTSLSVADIVNLRAYEGIADILTASGSSGPFSIGTNRPESPSGHGNRALEASRSKYGRSLDQVKAEMYRYDLDSVNESERPVETGVGWD